MRKSLIFALCALVVAGGLAPASAARDRRRPRVTYVTADGSVLVSNPASQRSDDLPLEVFGRATDDRGVRAVTAAWVPCTTSTSDSCSFMGVETALHGAGPVTLTCHHHRRMCDWRAPAPTAPGTYWFTATARDGAGNESRRSGILRLVVV